MTRFKHMAVNWVDGMKISRQHFEETDHYHTDQLRLAQAALLTPFNFGLLSGSDGSESLQIQVLGDASQQIRVKISRCAALTPDGSLILVDERNELILDTSLADMISQHQLRSAQDQQFYIVISVHLHERMMFGNPTENEMPVRHPYTLPSYRIHVVPVENINTRQWSGAQLIVGKMELNSGALKVMDDYIPASRTVRSYAGLRDWYDRFGSCLSDLEAYCFRIVQKIKMKSQKSTLSDSIQMLAERLISVLVADHTVFRRLVPHEPPVNMLVLLINSVQSIRVSLECMTEREKEEVLGYLGEWAEDSPGSLENRIIHTIQIPYDHNETVSSLKEAESFFQMWTALFSRLSQLEFIGKRKGQQVFIIESPVHEPPVQAEKTKSRWSPL